MKLLILAIAALFLAAGCDNRTPRPKTSTLAEEVKVALQQQANLRDAHIDVDSNGGVVMLKGSVGDVAAKQRVQHVAEKVKGVTWVQNQVSVVPKGALRGAG
jgi:osmotically-inducible protein OsmY